MDKFLLAIGISLVVLGVKLIYDARPIIKKYFSFGEENEATKGLKIIGFIFTIVGSILLYFNFSII